MKNCVRFLGIDPGIATVGWGVVDKHGSEVKLVDYGVIETKKQHALSARLAEVYSDLQNIFDKYKPECVGVESLLFCKNVKTAIAVGEARGVILLAIENYGLELMEFTPLQVKNGITGYGQAKKSQIQDCVKLIFNLKEIPKPDDAADAVAIALVAISAYNTR